MIISFEVNTVKIDTIKYKYKNNAADHNDICENHGEKEMPAAETVFQRLLKEEVINVFHHRVNKIGD